MRERVPFTKIERNQQFRVFDFLEYSLTILQPYHFEFAATAETASQGHNKVVQRSTIFWPRDG